MRKVAGIRTKAAVGLAGTDLALRNCRFTAPQHDREWKFAEPKVGRAVNQSPAQASARPLPQCEKQFAATHRALWFGSRPRPATGIFVFRVARAFDGVPDLKGFFSHFTFRQPLPGAMRSRDTNRWRMGIKS